ncbi:fungal-specific transcription factor domain-containing protein [Xylaria palmicola]|nr:fungal-specific transcription factor domain-containing protein [Xylaria palmicola]
MAGSPQDDIGAGARADETASTTGSESAQRLTQPAHLRSCVLCRQRKVKCDRRQPCSNCTRVGANCVHPPGAGRAAKRPRQVADAKVLDRLSQLETTIRRLQQQAKEREIDLHNPKPAQAPADNSLFNDSNQGPEVTQELGRLVIEESQSRYVSNMMWADLTESIEQLRGMFLDTHSSDRDSSQFDDSPPFHDVASPNLELSGPNAAILGYRSLAHSLRDFHPPVELSMKLFQLFHDNVLAVARIFHTPTLIRLFWAAVVAPDSLDKETEALLFAIYYSAAISIDPDQCANVVGAPRSTVVERYRFAAEQALARANLLNTHSTLLLQAATLYVSVLRSDDGTRTVWSLIALISHIARTMGFHRDGKAFNLPPFEAEMRRRIWHHIRLLDHRSTEYHGYEPTVADETAFDTRWPLNVSDADLSSNMAELPPESDGVTEMTLVHIRCHALRINQKMKRASNSPFRTRIQIIDDHDKWVDKYVERFDPSQPFDALAKEIAYIIAGRVRVATYYSEIAFRKRKRAANASRTHDDNKSTRWPSHGESESEPDDETLRDQLFACSIMVLERTNRIMQDSRLAHWSWHSHTYVQWQMLALILSEICIRPPSPQCDSAWESATTIYDVWRRIKFRDCTERGDNFFKPMGQLIAKAQRVRDAQQAEQRQQQAPYQTHSQVPGSAAVEQLMLGQQMLYDAAGSQASLRLGGMNPMPMNPESHPAGLDAITTATTPSDVSPNGLAMYDISSFDPFLEMLPDELQDEWFESVTQGSLNTQDPLPRPTSARPFFDFP